MLRAENSGLPPRALAVYQIRNDTLVDTGKRLRLDAGPVSIRTMPR